MKQQLTAAVAVFCMSIAAGVAQPRSALAETRQFSEKWMETRQIIARTKADWAAEKETLTQTALMATSARVKELVTALEQSVTSLALQLPPPLVEKLEPLLKRIPENPATTKFSASQRMQNVVGIINEIDKFNGPISAFSKIQKNSAGAEIQVEMINLGLARAYFVDKTGQYAGVGVPGA
jgi:hypothetical protein